MKEPASVPPKKLSGSIVSVRSRFPLSALLLLAVILLLLSSSSAKSKEKVIHSFTGEKDGSMPFSTLVFDKAGNLYGVATDGGADNDGTVFELTHSSDHQWTGHVLYAFRGGSDGASPQAGLIFDQAGNLYGTTSSGGGNGCFNGCGTVFELSPSGNGRWTETVLYAFSGGADGASPKGRLVFDPSGNLYGTTLAGGNTTCNGSSCGVVFELSPSHGKWTETVLHSFTGGNDGASPFAGLIFDKAGNLYGTASLGGKFNGGAVFCLAPHGGSWTETILHAFKGGSDGYFPLAGVVFHKSHLYGTTYSGGSKVCGSTGCGTVFQLAPRANGNWKETVIHRFHIHDGLESLATPVLDKAGNLYATAFEGGTKSNCGTAFELTPSSDGKWKDTVLHQFCSGIKDGATPEGSL